MMTDTELDERPAPIKSGDGIRVEKSVTIGRPVSEVYAFWRDFSNLPSFLEHLGSVVPHGETESHWIAMTPKGEKVEWDARIIEDKRDELIVWQSLPGSNLESAGSVRFSPATGGRGTVVKVALKYAPAGGRVGKLFAKFFSKEAEKETAQGLFNCKCLLETGEIPSVEGQPQGDNNNSTDSNS